MRETSAGALACRKPLQMRSSASCLSPAPVRGSRARRARPARLDGGSQQRPRERDPGLTRWELGAILPESSITTIEDDLLGLLEDRPGRDAAVWNAPRGSPDPSGRQADEGRADLHRVTAIGECGLAGGRSDREVGRVAPLHPIGTALEAAEGHRHAKQPDRHEHGRRQQSTADRAPVHDRVISKRA